MPKAANGAPPEADDGVEARKDQVAVGWRERARYSYAKWGESLPCQECHHVHAQLWDLHIEGGYREEHRPLWYYVKSVFYPNNQSANVWTHFLPLIFNIYRYWVAIKGFDDPADPIHYPFYIHGLGVCLLLLVSSIAHTFCSRSEYASRCCFSADFAAIYNYGVACMVALESYLCPFYLYCNGPSTAYYSIALVCYSLVGNVLSLCTHAFRSKAKHLTRALCCIVGMVTVLSPCIIRYSMTSPSMNHPTSLVGRRYVNLFFAHVICLIAGGFFYATKIPEVYFPRTFDNLGNSHNWFHVFTAAGTYLQSVILLGVLEEVKDGIKQGHLSPADFDTFWIGTFTTFFFSFISLTLTMMTYVYVTYRPHKHKVT